VRALAWTAILLLLTLAGCIWGQAPPPVVEYRDDIITIEDYEVRPLDPMEGGEVYMRFLVRNNGDKEVSRVVVDFFDLPGFRVTRLSCGWGVREENSCVFEGMQALGFARSVAEVYLRMNAPEKAGEYGISFSITYDYSGRRVASMPIIPPIQAEPMYIKFRQTDPTFGPVRLEIEPPVGREKIVDDRVVREHWVVGGEVFEVKLRFTHIGRVPAKILPTNISRERISIRVSPNLREPLVEPKGMHCIKTELYPASIEVPPTGEMSCYLNSSLVETESMGEVDVRFGYTYSYLRTQGFVVRERPA
jgi:hypothetical protein